MLVLFSLVEGLNLAYIIRFPQFTADVIDDIKGREVFVFFSFLLLQ